LTETADVVIVGGGIVGSSVAYHLAERGCRDVLVIERESHQGLGSTGKSMGGVRSQFSSPINIQMSLYSIDVFTRFEEITGQTSGYKAHGYLFVALNAGQLKNLEENCGRLRSLGCKGLEMISPDDIRRMVPQLRSDDIVGGRYCPTDGFVDPNSVMMGFIARAREKGVRLWLDTAVTGVVVERGEVTAVATTRGQVATRSVVNAAGPWAAEVARLAGKELPVTPLRRQIIKTEPFDGLPRRFPMVIDMSTGFHFRREGSAILLAWNDPAESPGYKTSFNTSFIEKVLTHAVSRVPVLSDAAVNPSRCWAGMYEMSPDHHAIIGPASGVKGLFFANGFSGHGVMHSPATGRIVSDLIVDHASPLFDAAPLGVERFAEGRLLEEPAIL
jgi:sarcosine oxidase subunit beta